MAEHPDKFKTFRAALAGFKPADMAKDLGGFPLHAGAELLYREKGYLT